MGTKLHGIFSVDSIDSSGEIVDLGGIDIYSLPRDGLANFEHKNDLPSQIVGKILYAKKIFKEEDCENDEQLYFWIKINRPYLYGIVELFDEEGHTEAKNLAAIARYSMKNKEKLFCPVLNFSVEGVTLVKKGQKILRSVARRIAITVKPCNKQAFAEILGWEAEQQAKNSILINISKAEEQRSVFGGYLSVFKKAVDSIKTQGFSKTEMVKHTHGYDLDEKGNGKTTSTSDGPDHIHAIKNGVIQAAGEGNHTHGLDDSDQTLTKLELAIGRAKTLSSVIKPKRNFPADKAPDKLRTGDRISYSTTRKPKTGSQIYKDPDTFKTEDMSKALSAGSYDASPSSLSQGAALQQEDLAGKVKDVGYTKNKNRALAAYRDWRGDKKGQFKEYLKMEMPDVSDNFIKIFADLVDKVEFKKTEQVMECIFEASLDQFDWEKLFKAENNKKGPDFKTLKKNKVKLSDEEREEAINADAVWHPGNHDNPVCAIWKSEVNGKTYYGTNTHRAFNTAPTLKGAISKYHSFIKGTA